MMKSDREIEVVNIYFVNNDVNSYIVETTDWQMEPEDVSAYACEKSNNESLRIWAEANRVYGWISLEDMYESEIMEFVNYTQDDAEEDQAVSQNAEDTYFDALEASLCGYRIRY